MNKWIRRTAGTVGIAGGALLLGTAAHADNPVIADPQSLHGVTDTASLDGGISGVGVSVDTPGQRDTVGLLPDGGGPIRSGTNNGELGAVVHAPTKDGQPRDVFANGRTPDIFQALPITDVVPMDGLGMPVANARTLPAPAQEATGLPVRNLPIGTNMAGDAISRDGFAGNGLGLPLADQLPLNSGSPLGGGPALGNSPLGGGSPLGGLPLVGGSSQGGRAQTTPHAASSDQGAPVYSQESFTCRHGFAGRDNFAGRNRFAGQDGFAGRHRAEAALPTAGGLPVVGDVLRGGTLPTKANVNTLPGAPALPVHTLLAPGTSAAGASTGNAFNQVSGTAGNLTQGATGPRESLPISDEALPVVGGLTGKSGTRGVDLPDTRGIPVVGGVADGLMGGKHRAQYDARHSAR